MDLKKIIVNIGFKLLGKGLVSCSKIEEAIKKELESYEDGFTVELKVLNTDTKVGVKKMGSEFVYLGNTYDSQADLSIIFKSYESAFLLVVGKMAIYEGYSQHRFIVKGDFIQAMPFVRILYYVEAYLFPNFITKNILKERPKRSKTKARAYLGLLF